MTNRTAGEWRGRAFSGVVLTGLLSLSALSGGAGCKKDGDSKPQDDGDIGALAEDGTDAAAAETDAEVITSSLVSATATGGSLSLASTDLSAGGLGERGIGDGAKALYFPRNCLTVTSDEPNKTVTYGFADCAGPNGIFKIRGKITATYAVRGGTLVLNLVGTDLRVNRAVVDWSATAEITANGPAREMRWKGQLSGTTPRGKTFTRTTDKIIKWRFGERCFELSGTSDGTVRDRTLHTEIADFKRCQGSCPENGGRITVTNQDSKLKLEIKFDGTNRAEIVGPKGSTTLQLACQG